MKLILSLCIVLINTVNVYSETVFYVTSDLHYGFEGSEAANVDLISSMQSLYNKEYKTDDGKFALMPDFILIAGDVIHRSNDKVIIKDELKLFTEHWGIQSKDIMGCNVYATIGNHDYDSDNSVDGIVSDFMKKNYGGSHYSFYTNDVHIICLGLPAESDIKWLETDLRNMKDKDLPVVICQHFPLASGEMSDLRESYLDVIKDYNIVAVFSGHFHRSEHYVFNDSNNDENYDIFIADSPSRHTAPNYYYVVKIDDKKLNVLEYQWTDKSGFTEEYSFNIIP